MAQHGTQSRSEQLDAMDGHFAGLYRLSQMRPMLMQHFIAAAATRILQ